MRRFERGGGVLASGSKGTGFPWWIRGETGGAEGVGTELQKATQVAWLCPCSRSLVESAHPRVEWG